MMNRSSEKIAKLLLEKSIIKINFKTPFRFVSGILSPIYEDDRQLISFPEDREIIVHEMMRLCIDNIGRSKFDYVAGVATAAIPWAAWLADKLNKPMLYIRPIPKKHGTGKQIEGLLGKGKKVLVIEAMISTGGSLLAAVDAVEREGGKVEDIIIIYTHQIAGVIEKFNERDLKLHNLTEFSTVVQTAFEMSIITKKEKEKILGWNKDPAGWGKKQGFEK